MAAPRSVLHVSVFLMIVNQKSACVGFHLLTVTWSDTLKYLASPFYTYREYHTDRRPRHTEALWKKAQVGA